MEKKNNSLVIVLMGVIIVIIVILAVLCVLFTTGKISFNTNEIENNETANTEKNEENNSNENNDNTQDKEKNNEKLFYDVNELKLKIDDNYKVFEDITKNRNEIEEIRIGNGDYYASLYLNGDVNVRAYINDKWNSSLLNIHRIVDIIEFSIPAENNEQLMYLLDENGNVYSYKFGNINNNNYDVTKIESVSNVKKLFISRYSKINAGGSWALFAITENNECVMLNAESV